MTRFLALANIFGDSFFLSHILSEVTDHNVDGLLICGSVGGARVWPIAPDATDEDMLYMKSRGVFPFKVTEEEFVFFSKQFENLLNSPDEISQSLIDLFEKGQKQLEKSTFSVSLFRETLNLLSIFAQEKNIPVFIVAGGHDPKEAEHILDEYMELYPDVFFHSHGNLFTCKDLHIIGIGGSISTEYDTRLFRPDFLNARNKSHSYYVKNLLEEQTSPHELNRSEEDVDVILNRTFSKVEGKNVVLLSHCPPKGSGADIIAQEGDSLINMGSETIRHYLTKKNTKMVVSGEISHCSGVTKVENTTVINVGQLSGLNLPIFNVRNVFDEIAQSYEPVQIWEPVGGMAAIIEYNGTVNAYPLIIQQHVEENESL